MNLIIFGWVQWLPLGFQFVLWWRLNRTITDYSLSSPLIVGGPILVVDPVPVPGTGLIPETNLGVALLLTRGGEDHPGMYLVISCCSH